MKEYLCLIRQNEFQDWYLLCVRSTMYCISCGSLDTVKGAIRLIRKRYRTSFQLNEAIENLSEKSRPNPMVYASYKALYNEQQGKYDAILEEVLEEEYEKVREKRKMRKPIMKSKGKVEYKKPQVLTPPVKKATGCKKPTVVRKVKKSRSVEME